MLIEFIATISAGFAAGGIALALRHLSGKRIPRGIIPVFAGLAMIAFLVWNDYTWFARTAAGLDERLEVVAGYPETSLWRPWTYAVPITERFMAYDTSSVMRNEAVPGQVLATVFLFARRVPPSSLPVLIDCEDRRRGDLTGGFAFEEDGSVSGAVWFDLAPDDPLAGAVCEGG